MKYNFFLLIFVVFGYYVQLVTSELKAETPDNSVKLTQENFKEAINLPDVGLFVMFQTGMFNSHLIDINLLSFLLRFVLLTRLVRSLQKSSKHLE
jgi:hypothetical protein